MSSNGESGRVVVFRERVKRIVTNTTFQWFVGVLIGISGIIIALLSYMQDREAGKQDEGPKDPSHQVEYAVPKQYTVGEHQPLFFQEAHTNLSVVFQTIEDEEFVSLNIAPAGKDSSVRAVFKGYTEKFTSSAGVFHVQILDIDYNKRRVVLQVNQKI